MMTAASPKHRFKSRIEDCEVVDKVALAEYRQKRDEWLRWYELNEGEPNSIQQQLFSMYFHDMAFRILREAQEKTVSSITAPSSGLLSHLLDQGYVATQVLAIRRLLDTRPDVISVRRLLDDVSKHQRLLTREIYVCYDGLPYDPESWQSLPPTTETQIWGIEAPGLRDYVGSRERHKTFDRLSGTSPTDRERSDLIQPCILDKLDQRLKAAPAAKIIKLSHKFFAHAADLASLGSLQYTGVILADIEEVQRIITRVERAITDEILFVAEAREVIPMPPLGLFKGLDSPYASAEAIEFMYQRWDQITTERNKWSKGIPDDLYS
jgi:hypothetical protein